jgi:mRNA interferase HigB
MNVIGKKILSEFSARHADVRERLSAWLNEAEEANWKRSQDIKQRYASASFLADNIVVFNIKGNDYRLVAKIDYKNQIVLIKKIGTHAEYSRWKL